MMTDVSAFSGRGIAREKLEGVPWHRVLWRWLLVGMGMLASQPGANGKETEVPRNKFLLLYNYNWARPQILAFLTFQLHFSTWIY